jgi:hypothetical protein
MELVVSIFSGEIKSEQLPKWLGLPFSKIVDLSCLIICLIFDVKICHWIRNIHLVHSNQKSDAI